MDPIDGLKDSGAVERSRCKHSGPGIIPGWQEWLKPETVEVRNRRGRSSAGRNIPADETEDILFALAQAVEQRDRHTAGHCERLAFISVGLGMAMRLPKLDLLALYRGGFLHDIGKVGMPDSILFKPSALSAEEWIVMRSHPLRGVEICRPMKSLAPVLSIIRSHHERCDGSGYPDGLRGRQIPLLARVLQIADIYDALTSPRPYKPALPPGVALEIMEQEAAKGWRDPHLMRLFFKLHERVISRFAEYQADREQNMEQMQASLRNLQQFLTEDAAAHWVPQINPISAEYVPPS